MTALSRPFDYVASEVGDVAGRRTALVPDSRRTVVQVAARQDRAA